MNLYGVATGTNAYSLRVPEPPGYQLCVGDVITVNFLNANTDAATLSINGRDAFPLLVNGAAAASGDLEAGKDLQFTFTGSSLNLDSGGGGSLSADDILTALAGVAIDLGTSSGTANALAGASLVDTATTFTAGRLYRIRTNAANSGAATCAINGGTGVAMKKSPSSAALASGDIADATELLLFFDGTNLQVLAGLTVSATDSTSFEAKKTSQTWSAGATTICTWDTAITNTLPLSYSGGVWTATADCEFDYEAVIYNGGVSNTIVAGFIPYKNGSAYSSGVYGPIVYAVRIYGHVKLTSGETFDLRAYISSAISPDVTNLYTANCRFWGR